VSATRSLRQSVLPAADSSIGGFDKIRSIHTIGEQANPFCSQSRQEGSAGFINGYDIPQEEIYWFTIRHRLVAARLDHFDAFARNFTIDRETCAFVAGLLV